MGPILPTECSYAWRFKIPGHALAAWAARHQISLFIMVLIPKKPRQVSVMLVLQSFLFEPSAFCFISANTP